MSRFDVIAFDADDTLWHNEHLYLQTQAELGNLLAGYGVTPKILEERLYQTENHNIRVFGYGIKSFTLSMIQTGIELTDGRLSGQDVLAIIGLAKAQLEAPIELLEHAPAVVSRLAVRYRLMVVTKGESMEQEAKLARSGLAKVIKDIEVVSDKTPQNYARLFESHALNPGKVIMVGDSLRSDILPVLELGAYAVYIPYPGAWLHEAADAPAAGTPRYYRLEHLGQLPGLLARLESQA